MRRCQRTAVFLSFGRISFQLFKAASYRKLDLSAYRATYAYLTTLSEWADELRVFTLKLLLAVIFCLGMLAAFLFICQYCHLYRVFHFAINLFWKSPLLIFFVDSMCQHLDMITPVVSCLWWSYCWPECFYAGFFWLLFFCFYMLSNVQTPETLRNVSRLQADDVV